MCHEIDIHLGAEHPTRWANANNAIWNWINFQCFAQKVKQKWKMHEAHRSCTKTRWIRKRCQFVEIHIFMISPLFFPLPFRLAQCQERVYININMILAMLPTRHIARFPCYEGKNASEKLISFNSVEYEEREIFMCREWKRMCGCFGRLVGWSLRYGFHLLRCFK